MKKNYKYLKALTWEARNNPSMWVEDPECEELIDYYHPSKNRLNAYQLNNSKTIIYLDDETYTNMVRADWRDEYEEKEHQKRCVSLDYLYDNFELEVSDSGQLITKDNYYLYCDDQMEIEEDEARDYLINKVKNFVDTIMFLLLYIVVTKVMQNIVMSIIADLMKKVGLKSAKR